MNSQYCSDALELSNALAPYSSGHIFRGQVKHYTTDDGAPKLTTSFQRHGCIPRLMRKWTYYAHELLCVMSDHRRDFSIPFTNALLQHYGWRSFFIDASASPNVAAWFAAHAYSQEDVLESGEDCHENSVLLHCQTAKYSIRDAADLGHLYVFGIDSLRHAKIGTVDLNTLSDDRNFRFVSQEAWLIGELTHAFPTHLITAHIQAPVSAFAEYAAQSGLTNEYECLFPPRSKDAILASLLSIPWIQPFNNTQIFSRGLPLPEYDYELKRHDESEAFFNPFWIDEERACINSEQFTQTPFYRTDELAQFHINPPSRPLEHLKNLLKAKSNIVIEIDGLIRHPEFPKEMEYGKGVVIQKNDDLVEIYELCVENPGLLCTGFGANLGWTYRFDTEARLIRVNSPNDCPCKNIHRHQRHLALIFCLNDCLANGRVRQLGHLSYELLP